MKVQQETATGMVLQVDGFALHRDGGDGEFRVRDIELAERLGYDRPRVIRELIATMVETGELPGIHVRRAVRRTSMPRGGERAVEGREYWLDRFEALLVVMQSKAPNAIPMRRVIADVFYKALDELERNRSAIRRLPEHIERWFLAPSASKFEALWPDSLVRELERLHGRDWTGGRHPHHMKSTYPAIYDRIMTSPIAAAMMERNPDRARIRHHQLITPEARPFVVAQLGIIEAIARTSASKADFWARMDREYGHAYLQLQFGAMS
jgi:hypothetical protein